MVQEHGQKQKNRQNGSNPVIVGGTDMKMADIPPMALRKSVDRLIILMLPAGW